jgi:hypothetical protein
MASQSQYDFNVVCTYLTIQTQSNSSQNLLVSIRATWIDFHISLLHYPIIVFDNLKPIYLFISSYDISRVVKLIWISNLCCRIF